MIDKTKPAIENCPRFDNCNINCCPLLGCPMQIRNDPSDPAIIRKEKCIPKKKRMEIGKAFDLPNLGLKPREFSAYKMEKEAREREIMQADKEGVEFIGQNQPKQAMADSGSAE